jgi:hypothetical protein
MLWSGLRKAYSNNIGSGEVGAWQVTTTLDFKGNPGFYFTLHLKGKIDNATF